MNKSAIKAKLKDLERWKDEAKELLTKQGVQDVENHSSILNFDNKISSLKSELITSVNVEPVKKKPVETEEKKKDVHKGPQHFQQNSDRYQENRMNRDFNWLLKMDSFMPPYMKTNLEKMPNNKGYIWKGIHYYGKCPSEHPHDVTVLFEKNNQKMLIHEYSSHFYRIFEKQDKSQPKKLVFEKMIVRRF
jgi:hypothetical protein